MKNLWLIAFALLTLSVACKKSEDEKPSGGGSSTSSCLVNKITDGSGGTDQYYYDSQDRVTKVVSTDSSGSKDQTYTYSGNLVTVDDGNGSTIKYYLNNKGLADSAVYTLSVLGEIRMQNEYNSVGQPVKSTVFGQFFGTEINQISYYELTNGNITKIRVVQDTAQSVTNMTYYTDKTNHAKRTEELSGFMYTSPNLIKSVTDSDGNITNYTYEYDSNGKHTKQTYDDGIEVVSSVFDWLCK